MTALTSAEMKRALLLLTKRHPKKDRNYTISEAARLTGVARSSIYRSLSKSKKEVK